MARWLRRLLLIGAAGWIIVLSTHCHQPPIETPGAAVEEPAHTMYVIRHGWHAGIAVRTDALGESAWPVLDDFAGHRAGHRYVEVGWGDAGYYPNPSPRVGSLLRAGAWPTASVVHVALFDRPVQQAFPRHDIVAIEVSDEAVQRFAAFVQATFEGERPDPVADGHYYTSAFYPSHLSYHVFNNCNHWAASALQALGCDMQPALTMRVEQLLDDAAHCGRAIQSAP